MRHIIMLLMVLGCSMSVVAVEHCSVVDPLERVNRATYKFNKVTDQLFLRPTAHIYSRVIPNTGQNMVRNFFYNLANIPTFINEILQGRFANAADTFTRFTINSTVGVLGLFDTASYLEIPKHKADFGQTLAKYGYRKSSYLVLPLLGPSTIRDGIGKGFDNFASVQGNINNVRVKNQLLAADIVNNRAGLIPKEDLLDAAVDEYIWVREAYKQNRNYILYSKNIIHPVQGDIDNSDNLLGEPPE